VISCLKIILIKVLMIKDIA